MVENHELVLDRQVGSEQIFHRMDNTTRREVAAAVIVAANDQDARMIATGMEERS